MKLKLASCLGNISIFYLIELYVLITKQKLK